MIVQHNLLAMNSSRQLGINVGNQESSMFKLSSGYRINKAADNAAGLSISEKMRGQIRGLNRASDNIQDGISLLQTADGALNEVQSMVQRIRELSVQASNDTNTVDDRDSIQDEVDGLVQEITCISEDTEFNKLKLLDGSLEAAAGTSSPMESLDNISNIQAMAQSTDMIDDNKIGLIFTDESDYDSVQTETGSSTSTAYGTAIMEDLQNQIVPQAVQSILDTYSGAFSYLNGSSIGIGLRLYSDSSSSTLAYVSCGATASGTTGTLSFTLAVNVSSLDFTGEELTDSSREDLEATISHEMIHAFMDESVTAGMLGYNGSSFVTAYASWFKEGMAQTSGGGADWVKYGLGITSSSSDSAIKTALSTLTSGTNAANYGVGYLACMYLGYLAAGGTGSVTASNVSDGLDIVMQSLVSGKSLDQTIADYTTYSGLTDFTTNLQNDTSAYDFVRNLMTAMGTGRGSVITGDLSDTDLLANVDLTSLELFDLDTNNDIVKNSYPSEVTVFSGGAATQSGTKAVAEAPEAPAVGGESTPTSTVINLSDLLSVNFPGISGAEYDQSTNTITITGDGTYTFTGSNTGTKIVVNSGVTASMDADNITCEEIYGNSGSVLTINGGVTSTNGINGSITVTNNGIINGDLNVLGVSNGDNGVINGDVTESGGNIYNRGVITGTCTGTVFHYVDSFVKNITAPSAVDAGSNLTDTASLASYITAAYNGTTTVLNGVWTVTDKDGNVVSDPASVTMNDGDSYVYTLTFDGTPYNMYFDSSDTEAKYLSDTSEAQTVDGGTISASGRVLTYSYTLTSSDVSGGPLTGSGSTGSSADGGLNLQIGANAGQSMKIYIDGMSAADLGIDVISVTSFANAQSAITLCDDANEKVSDLRSRLGAYQNRLEHAASNSDNMAENLQEAESRIRDVDMADEMVQYSKASILVQAAQSILAQVSKEPEGILSLLQ